MENKKKKNIVDEALLDIKVIQEALQKNTKAPAQIVAEPLVSSGKKLSYKEKRELELLPALIEQLDAQVSDLQTEVNDPEFFKNSAEQTQQRLNLLADTESKLAQAYARWEELEALNQ